MIEKPTIRVGLTEGHGMSQEMVLSPPDGVEYTFLSPTAAAPGAIRSPIKGYFGSYESSECDLIEAVISPVFTSNRWIYSLACFQEALAFNFYGLPIPRFMRKAGMHHLFRRPNFHGLVFWSHAGLNTMANYGGIDIASFDVPATVVYPAVRSQVAPVHAHRDCRFQLLFSGDFFRKGGVNVVDAFIQLQREIPGLRLVVCSSPQIDFNTSDSDLRNRYFEILTNHPGIEWMGRVDRSIILEKVLPETDIYLIPTYNEAFGFAVLEAMAYGIPVIATNIFAIPEMIEHSTSGYLIDVSDFDVERLFAGYVVNRIPADFREYVTTGVLQGMREILSSPDKLEHMGRAALEAARSRFSVEVRNSKMLELYRAALR